MQLDAFISSKNSRGVGINGNVKRFLPQHIKFRAFFGVIFTWSSRAVLRMIILIFCKLKSNAVWFIKMIST